MLALTIQALIALKKGTPLIKYSRKGKPKFCPFRVSSDETSLIWYSRGRERNLSLSAVIKIIPGQRTAVFRRYLRPEKEYLSFSLIYNNGERSLDLICKDISETEVWLAGLNALTSSGQTTPFKRTRSEIPDLKLSSELSQSSRRFGATLKFTNSSISRGRLSTDSSTFNSPKSDVGYEGGNMQGRASTGEGFRISVSSSNPSWSSHASGQDDIESLGDLYIWGDVWFDTTDGSAQKDVLTPKPLESNVVLDVHQIACGIRHIGLVTRQGELFTWGEESGGRLGHGVEKDVNRPQLVEFLAIANVEFAACGEFHTCAISGLGDLYSWGDGSHNVGLLGHGTDVSHWIPKRISGPLEGLQVLSVACGSWHSALITSNGKLFTFGDGTYAALGHGDRESVPYPKEVNLLSGLKTMKVACGVWHTAAIVELMGQPGSNVLSRKLFTWGDGDKYRLGHGNKDMHLVPTVVSALVDYNFHQLACGHCITTALTTSGHVFTVGSTSYGQLGNPTSDGKLPCLVQDKLVGEFVEEISCGAYHVAVLTSRNEVFTWGRGENGRLGHGDTEDRKSPTLVEALKDRHVKNIACGSNYTASVCIHKWVSGADQSVCSGCRQAFGFTRKRHNCYNCGLAHCHSCSSKKALKAALAPTPGKPHRVCDSCYNKLKAAESGIGIGTNNNNNINKRAPTPPRLEVGMGDPRTSRILLSPRTEPVKYRQVRTGNHGTMNDSYSIVRTSQVPSNVQLKDIAFPSSLTALQHGCNPILTSSSNSQPRSSLNSRPSSVYARKPSPTRSTTPIFSRGVIDSLKKTNEVLNQEVTKLHNQVYIFPCPDMILLDAYLYKGLKKEVTKMQRDAQETNNLASKVSSKFVVARDIIASVATEGQISFMMLSGSSLMNTLDQLNFFLPLYVFQFKEIREKLPDEVLNSETFKDMNAQIEAILNTDEPRMSDQQIHKDGDSANRQNNEGIRHDGDDREHASQENHENSGSGGLKEVIEQFEPGVYVTLLKLQNGTKIFKRVKFSKRRFAEQQAEQWWKENKGRLLKRYNPTLPYTSPNESSTTQTSTEGDSSETAPSS
ncbi:PH, RCC1 and FYVE domains-containing protein 1-like [Impatiens glandulifera]|uniref:PH, RCC1 and FYVE domains-containing protein 1-like n=1 Tax=Impatiens glandulifera TaxID=253017 RepID=UPI001FB08D2E|nr:PH, RCC1 and FYVE domains-containing protein 1-like [Impatiens glandulifera]